MLKYEFDIKEIILELFSEREGKGSENRRLIRYCDMCEKFLEGLTEQQQEEYQKIEDYRDNIESDTQENLVEFVIEFFRAFFKS